MKSVHRREVGLAVVLSGVAGYLDAVGFIELKGHFVSFMSGNTTDLATRVGSGDLAGIALAATLIGMFVLGVVLGAVVARWRDGRTSVLVVTTLGLAATALAATAWPTTAVTVGLPIAMGAMNATFLSSGEVSIGLTYMTGTLVKAGQRIVDAVSGGPRWLWLRHLSLWIALLVGGVAGAFGHRLLGPAAAIGLSAAVTAVVTAVTVVVRRRTGEYGRSVTTPRLRETPAATDIGSDTGT